MLNSLQWSQTDVRNTQKAKRRNIKHKRTILISFLFFFFFFLPDVVSKAVSEAFTHIDRWKRSSYFVTYQKFDIRYWRSGHSHILFQNKKPVASVWLFSPKIPAFVLLRLRCFRNERETAFVHSARSLVFTKQVSNCSVCYGFPVFKSHTAVCIERNIWQS